MSPEEVRFSFGDNWQRFLDELHPAAVERMASYVADWLGEDLAGRRLIDVGSGQGLTSLVAHQLGADVTSIDIDPMSVAATSRLWRKAGQPSDWTVEQRSILDDPKGLGLFDVVISWGVLHHTGDMWTALDNAASLVAPNGRLWIALYARTKHSNRSLRLKRVYNQTPRSLKRMVRGLYALPKLTKMAIRRDFSPMSGYHRKRGMNWWRDIEDWLGGLPYEVTATGELLAVLRPRGFNLLRMHDATGEGDNNVFLFEMNASRSAGAT